MLKYLLIGATLLTPLAVANETPADQTPSELNELEMSLDPEKTRLESIPKDEDGYMLLEYDHLVPLGYEFPEEEEGDWDLTDDELISGGFAPDQLIAPTVAGLNGQKIKLPGFMLPIRRNQTKVFSFLLVPFIGACVHVPPPPTNQMIYIEHKEGLDIIDLWAPINIWGEMVVKDSKTEYGDTGYQLKLHKIAPYEY